MPLVAAGTIEVQSARLRLSEGYTSELILSGGGLIVTGLYSVTNFMSWTGGQILPAGLWWHAPVGLLRIQLGATASFAGPAAKGITGTILENVGIMSWGDVAPTFQNAVLRNHGAFHMYASNFDAASNAASWIDNHGTLVRHGVETLHVSPLFRINNLSTGRFEVEGGLVGTLRGTNAGVIAGVPIAQLRLGAFTMAGGSIEGFGSIRAEGIAVVVWQAGTIGPGGTFTLTSNASLHLSGGGARVLLRDLTTSGLVTWSGGTLHLVESVLLNQADGIINVFDTGGWTGFGASIVNLGTLNKLGAGAFSVARSGLSIDNPGRIGVLGGSLTLVASAVPHVSGSTLTGGRWNVLNGATLNLVGASILTNSATISIAGSGATFDAINGLRVNDGTLTLADTTFAIQPGSGVFLNHGKLSVFSGGTLNVQGDLTFTSASRFLAGISSPNDHGRVTATGTIATDGLIESLFTLFIPVPTDSFAILTTAGSTVIGFFTSVVTSGLPNGLTVSTVYLPWAVRLSVD